MAYNEQHKRMLHRLGYYDYQYGLIHRHIGQDEGWNGHLVKCRNYIIRAINEIKPLKVTVLGSGWLLDLPLAEMLEKVQTVTLIDIVQPREVRSQVASFSNVELVEEDVTGGLAEEVWGKRQKSSFLKKTDSLGDISVPMYKLKGDPGLVISLNILSQLDVLPVEFLRKKSKVTEEEILNFRKRVQDNHIRLLSGHSSVLISDLAEVFTDSSGKRTEIKTVVAGLPEGEGREEWTWDFDLKRSDYYEKRSVLKVVALTLQP